MKDGTPELLVLEHADAVAAEGAGRILEAAREARERRGGRADIAVSGGRISALLFDRLTAAREDWTGVHLWLSDERCVPHTDEESNVRLVNERLAAPGVVTHFPPDSGDAELRAAAYAAQLKDYVLDLVVLGLGEDAHTASLFPGNAALDDPRTVVPVHDSPKPPSDRLTLGLGVLSAARARLVLTTGEGKREALAHALGEPDRQYPSSLLPAAYTTVVVDRTAAPDGPGPGGPR